MTDPALAERPLRRILVAIDASRPSLEALEAAAILAARHGAELAGLFVEDIDLLRAAELPFAGPLALIGGSPLPAASIGASVRALAERARAALAEVATTRQLRWSFRVARGRVEVEVLQAAVEADLLALGRVGRGLAGGRRPGSTAQAAASRARAPVLLAAGEAANALPLWVAWDGSSGAEAALDLALRLAGSGDASPVLLVAAAGPAEAEALAAAASARAGRPLAWRFAGGPSPGDLRRALPFRAALVVGPASPVVGGTAGLERLLADARGPVLLAR